MLKFILFLILILYAIYRVGGFLFKVFFIGAQAQQRPHSNQGQRPGKTPPNSNVRVDYVPEDKKKSEENPNGGQYVDFEEVK